VRAGSSCDSPLKIPFACQQYASASGHCNEPAAIEQPEVIGQILAHLERTARRGLSPGASINDVVDDRLIDELSGTVVLNGTPVEVEAAPTR